MHSVFRTSMRMGFHHSVARFAAWCVAGVVAGVPVAAFSQHNHAQSGVEHAQAAINNIADFDEQTWNNLLRYGPRPAAYVFTTTYCATCPQAFEKLAAATRRQRKPVELAAVVMDVGPERVGVHAHHYQGATRFYVFDGFAPAIRQSVDPQWPNVTPYVVLIDRAGTVIYRGIGAPGAKVLARWR